MKSYAVLNAMPAENFLVPENFVTANDCRPEYQKEQYEKGLAFGLKCEYITIACNSTWGGKGKDGGSTCSYEGIGYHAGTADLLRGFLASGTPVVVYRSTEAGLTETWIVGEKPASYS